jgi:tetrahydromethanopterin S-methyltransferase subunit G
MDIEFPLQHKDYRIQRASTESLVRIEVFAAPDAKKVARRIIELYEKTDVEDSEVNNLWFGGGHAGMPEHHVWAGTADGSSVMPRLDEIQSIVENVISDTTQQ